MKNALQCLCEMLTNLYICEGIMKIFKNLFLFILIAFILSCSMESELDTTDFSVSLNLQHLVQNKNNLQGRSATENSSLTLTLYNSQTFPEEQAIKEVLKNRLPVVSSVKVPVSSSEPTKVSFLKIPVGINAIIVAECTIIGEKGKTKNYYTGTSDIFEVQRGRNSVEINLEKIINVGSVQFDHESGYVDYGTNVTLSCDTIGAQILYKFGDGEWINSGSSTVQIEINRDVRITAQAKCGSKESDESRAEYIVKYKVLFEENGGNEIEDKTGTSKIPVLLDEINPRKEGYSFEGWYLDSAFNEQFEDNEVSPDDATYGVITLYAKWEAITYTVVFKPNGGDDFIFEPSQTFTYDVPQNLKENVFTREGYAFNGWTINADGSGTSYTDKQEVKNLASTQGTEVTLYAQWKKIESKIEDVGLTFDLSNSVILINNEIGLENYRKIVNEEIKSLSVPYIDNTYSTMNVTCQYSAKLQNDVTVSNWVPIGTEENPFFSSFYGNGKSITINGMSSGYDYAGLFGCVQNATISNVVVKGDISSESAKYVGGIVAYCVVGASSTTIKNCVNKANVNLSTRASSNDEYIAVGGIVGYAEGNCNVENSVNNGEVKNSATGNFTSTAGIIGMVGNNTYNITNCVNLGKITGEANVAGIVAGINKDTLSPLIQIDKCINAGAINSEELYLAGIACAATDAWSSYITNSINLSALTGCSKAGIYYNAKSISFDITYCMNVGQNSADVNQHNYPISNKTEEISNCYYDSSKVIPGVDGDDNGTPKSTDELKTDTPFDSWSEDNWSFDIDRYPLPNIGENIPEGEDGVYWSAVLTAAT